MNQITPKLHGLFLLLALSATVYSQSAKPIATNKPEKVIQGAPKKLAHTAPLNEGFSFWIKDFKVDHQALNNNVNISVSFRYVPNIANTEYPDFRLLAKDVETFLTNYPNEEDYWEIVNKQLTAQLMNKYTALANITIEIKIDPSSSIPYERASRVTRERLSRKRSGGL
jgi:hypothetical protein